ncbi:MAG: alanine--tRNA ligase [Deltaproteobacteria bacterium]|nr:alanine--tRNA ligase [Deltaproteobacteria bacterium]
MTSREIRETFLRFFESQGHTRVASSSLVPAGDPTLLFTNAGMVQFKKVFLGEDPRPYTRAASSQKCVRAGGKHNDLENVGFTARHHTFFEMLGNFSFGDYFKEGAIEMAWELLTRHYKLPADKLWATVFHEDEEAARLWEKIAGLPPSRIIGLGEKDNFWAMGDTGPCGPCSEILIDQGEAMSCGPDCGIGKCECDRYLEIWNNVFMQFNRTADGVLHPLPKPSIDTGMGLERLCAVVQGVKSNFDCDLLRPVIAGIEALAGQAYGASETQNVPFRVIADHSRATAFLIADGVLPSNEGRGYVLRRIMRRAIRFGRRLNLPTPFLSRVCDRVVELMGEFYPELVSARHIMTQVVTGEEERFADTLDHGLKLLGEELGCLKTHSRKILPGEVAFKLYDTYGFPLDLVQDALREEGLALDLEGFETHMRAQREASRQSWKGGPGEDLPLVYQELAEWPATQFLGYDTLEGDSDVLALIVASGHNAQAEAGEEVEVVTGATPFYGESGGQVGDAGLISGDGWRIRVSNTQKLPNDLIVHQGKVEAGVVRVNDPVHLEVDAPRRRRIMAHHTATHLLQAVLRRRLGDHVKQSGSLVDPDRLRFDFIHYQAITPKELEAIELDLNQAVAANLPVHTDRMSMDQALEAGATALFEEKYGEAVRVVAIPEVSQELCGGTHVERTGDLGLCKITTETSIAAGIRRIEAVCGVEAVKLTQDLARELDRAAGLVKGGRGDLVARLEKLLALQKKLEKDLEALKGRLASTQAKDLLDQARRVEGVAVLALKVDAADPKSLRDFAVKFQDKLKSGIVVLGSAAGDKAMLIALVSKDLVKRFPAGEIIKAIAPTVGGSGGGRPDMAQAGGPDKDKLPAALEQVYEVVAQKAKG